MQIKNDYSMEWAGQKTTARRSWVRAYTNGDLGTIFRMDMVEQSLDVLFDDERMASYTFNQLDELKLAYCISIHKSQGSEFPVVVLPLFSGPPMLMTRNLLYTPSPARARSRHRRPVGSVLQMVEN